MIRIHVPAALAARAVFAVAVAIGVAYAAPAAADVVAQVRSFNFGNDHQTLLAGPDASASLPLQSFSRALNFDQFDPVNGVLQQVSFTIATGGTRIFGVTYNGGTGTISFSSSNRIGWSVFSNGDSNSAPISLPAQSTVGLSPGTYLGVSQNLNIVAAVNQTLLLPDLPSFTGTGSFDVSVFMETALSAIASGAGVIAQAINGSCDPNCGNFSWAGAVAGSVTIEYTFAAPVGEPATLAVLAAGLVGLVRSRRRG